MNTLRFIRHTLLPCVSQRKKGVVAALGMAFIGLAFTLSMPTLAATLAGVYTLDWFTFSNGGGQATGAAYTLNSTIGQPMAGSLSGGAYSMAVGFWRPDVPGGPITPTLDLAKSVSSSTARSGDTLTYTLSLTANGAPVTATLTDTLPMSMTYAGGSVVNGATYDPASRQIRYSGSIVPGNPVVITYRVTVAAGAAPGSVLANNAVATFNVDGVTYRVERTAVVAIPSAIAPSTLVLIYANGDNTLSSSMLALLNNAEKSAGTPGVVVMMLLDGPGPNDARLYHLQGDVDESCPNYINPTCNGRYTYGENVWAWTDDTANPYSLSEFLKGAILAYPGAQRVILSLVGHGSGWFPNVLLGQPSAWDGQPGGLLWDQNPGGFLSTKALGDALRWATQATGVKIDLLYLDACMMATSEVAYEVRDSVNVVLASENWTWASFPYDAYLNQSVITGAHSAAQIGTDWLNIQASLLRNNGYPFTLALIDTSKMSQLQASVDALASALTPTLPSGGASLAAAHTPGVCFDSSQDGLIDGHDNLCDLSGLARHLAVTFSGNPGVVSAAHGVENAVASTVLAEDHNSGSPWVKPGTRWEWESLGGLSIYAPLHEDDWKRSYYNGTSLRFAQNSAWAALLNTYWNAPPPAPPACATGCQPPAPINLAPINIQASAGHNDIHISWSLDNPLANLAGYHVLRQVTGSSFITLTTTPINSIQFTDGGLITGTTYCYQVNGVSSTGAVVGQSGLACAIFGQLTLWVPPVVARPGATNVIVPVNLSHGDGLCPVAIDVTLHYNPSVVIANGTVSPTIYTQGYQFVANTNVPGQVKITAIIPTCLKLNGPGSLFNVGFTISGTVGQISSLDFITGLINTVIYDDSDLNVPVSLALESGSVTVNNAFTRGDLNGDTVVNSADALISLRIANGQYTPTPDQRSACDVNGDGDCTAADSTQILCYIAFGSWNGCGPTLTTAAFRPSVSSGMAAANVVRIEIGPAGASAGQIVTAPVKIVNGEDFAGGTFTFQYDASRMTFSGVTPAALTAGFTIQSHVPEAGLVRISLARQTVINADGTIFNLRFTVAGGTSPSPMGLSTAKLNDVFGRDFATSALQREVQVVIIHNVFLPIARR